MQKTIVTCDKCGKDISFDEVNQRFKISVMTGSYVPKSAYIDVCNECMKAFLEGLNMEKLYYFEDPELPFKVKSYDQKVDKKHRKKGKKGRKKE